MRNLLALLGAAIVTFVGLGWYLGWYRLEPTPSPAPGHQSVTIDIDAAKINSDIHRGEQRVEQALEDASKGDTAKRAQSIATPLPKSPQ
jgi:hypothetical protein